MNNQLPTWPQLSTRLKVLGQKTMFNKMSSYDIIVNFCGTNDMIEVAICTYECGNMPRWTTFEVSNEDEAKKQTILVIEQCEKEVNS